MKLIRPRVTNAISKWNYTKGFLLVFVVSQEILTRILTTKKTPWSKKTAALTKNMNIWVVGISNQLFIKGSYTKAKFFLKKFWEGSVLWDRSILCSPFYLSLHFLQQGIFVWKFCVFNIRTFNLKVLLQFLKKVFVLKVFRFSFGFQVKYRKRSKYLVIVS